MGEIENILVKNLETVLTNNQRITSATKFIKDIQEELAVFKVSNKIDVVDLDRHYSLTKELNKYIESVEKCRMENVRSKDNIYHALENYPSVEVTVNYKNAPRSVSIVRNGHGEDVTYQLFYQKSEI